MIISKGFVSTRLNHYYKDNWNKVDCKFAVNTVLSQSTFTLLSLNHLIRPCNVPFKYNRRLFYRNGNPKMCDLRAVEQQFLDGKREIGLSNYSQFWFVLNVRFRFWRRLKIILLHQSTAVV